MNAETWLERQYWSDVIAVKPDETIQHRTAAARQVRERHPEHLDLAFGPHDRQRVDVFLPPGAGPWSLLIYIHGGYWQKNHKNDQAYLAPAWLAQGVAFATLGYRLLPDVSLPDIVSDIAGGMALLRDQAPGLQLDANRMVLSGLSAGAHLTAMYAASSPGAGLAGAVLLSGVYDLPPLETTSPGQAIAPSLKAPLADISPLAIAAPVGVPCLIGWGEAETDAFKSQSAALTAHYANRGVEVAQTTVAGANHFTAVEALRGDSGSEIVGFVKAALVPE
ncbi:MAG: alpha/beta hydrolase [Pseudomonadota bacterium]